MNSQICERSWVNGGVSIFPAIWLAVYYSKPNPTTIRINIQWQASRHTKLLMVQSPIAVTERKLTASQEKKTLTGWLIKVSHFQLIKKQKVVYR